MLLEMVTYIRDVICFSSIYLGIIAGVTLVVTVGLKCIQFRYFFKSWQLAFGTSKDAVSSKSKSDMSPFQAFLSALNISIGNGSLAGVATALHVGGPGVVFWMFCAGLLEMALRFAEVFLSVSFSKIAQNKKSSVLGGPFLYVQYLPFGKVIAVIYTIFLLFFGLIGGNAMQCQSISTVVHHTTGFPTWIVAAFLGSFVVYVMFGGAERIVKISDAIIPFKVGLFFVTILIVIGYHWQLIIPALILMIKSAFCVQAAVGAAVGMTIRQMIGYSIFRTVNACEAGLGTAAIFYSNTGNSNPLRDGLTSMLSVFMSINVATILVSLALVVTGVIGGEANGTAMVAQAYQTVFGFSGAYIVTLITLIFGFGVFVPYCYIARQCWLYLTNGKYEKIFIMLFATTSVVGSLMTITLVWTMIDIAVSCLLAINLSAILLLLPYLRAQLKNEQ